MANKNLDEPIRTAITSAHTEGQTCIVYKDGGLKIIDQENINGNVIVYVCAEDMAEIIEAAQPPYLAKNIVTYMRIYKKYTEAHGLDNDINSITVNDLIDFVENEIGEDQRKELGWNEQMKPA